MVESHGVAKCGVQVVDMHARCHRLQRDGAARSSARVAALNLARVLEAAGEQCIGANSDMTGIAEDRRRFQAIFADLVLQRRPPPDGAVSR